MPQKIILVISVFDIATETTPDGDKLYDLSVHLTLPEHKIDLAI